MMNEEEYENIVNDEDKIAGELEAGKEEAKMLLENPDKTERMLQRLEKKLKKIPIVGDSLSCVPTLISLVRSYINKEYDDIPIGSILAIVSALTYILSPIDLVPDFFPVVGYLDDAAVVAACWKLVKSDVEEYVKWREKNKREIEE